MGVINYNKFHILLNILGFNVVVVAGKPGESRKIMLGLISKFQVAAMFYDHLMYCHCGVYYGR